MLPVFTGIIEPCVKTSKIPSLGWIGGEDTEKANHSSPSLRQKRAKRRLPYQQWRLQRPKARFNYSSKYGNVIHSSPLSPVTVFWL